MTHLYEINEAELNEVDRLGLAYCRLCAWGWDEIVGPKPEGFDDLPDFDRRKFRRFRKPIRTKHDYIWPKLKGIEFLIGKDNTSRCWWIFELGRTEEQWREWCLTAKYDPRYYVNERQK